MNIISPRSNDKLLLQVLAHPAFLPKLTLREWDRLLPLARRAGVLGRFYIQLTENDRLDQIPESVRPHLEAAYIIATEDTRKIRWEVNRIQRALLNIDVPVILLKGAAYVLADLPCAKGRRVSDVDIMVPKDYLSKVENALHIFGWESVKSDDYDQEYYRRWMHELPPMRHKLRGTVIDVHHTILPPTSRLKPDPAELLMNSRPLDMEKFRVLSPEDMVLHSAVHAFHDGDFQRSLRDLVDLHELLCHFDIHAQFWRTLSQRAHELNLARPLFYALRYTQQFMETPVPASIFEQLSSAAPSWPITMLMDAMVSRTLTLTRPAPFGTVIALWLGYIRSHWLRMPPPLLLNHLLHKAFKRSKIRLKANQAGG